MNTIKSTIEIIPFSVENATFFKDLNVEWLQHYFEVEPIDEVVLSNPEEAIINKGGHIFFANYNDQIVGTFALLKIDETTFELSKMAVNSTIQGFGIGQKLLIFCVEFAKQQGIKKIILFSNTTLKPAIHLYRKVGFVEIPIQNNIYKRSDIKMELNIV